MLPVSARIAIRLMPGQRLHQDFLALAVQFSAQQTQPGGIAAGPSKRSDKARSDHILSDRQDWNGFCRAPRGLDGWIARGKDNVHIGFDDCCRVFGKLVAPQAKTGVVDDQILPADKSVRFHSLDQGVSPGRVTWAELHIAEAIDAAGLLRARGKRPSRRHAGQRA